MVTKTTYDNTSDFLIAPENAEALSCRISNADVDDGIVRAGTPLYVASGKSIFLDRDEVLTTSSANSAVLSGIARHTYYEKDFDENVANGAILYKGTVDIYKLDSDVQDLITSDVISGLPQITFIKGAK